LITSGVKYTYEQKIVYLAKVSTMKCIIVDDDDVSRMAIAKCVERLPALELLASFPSAKSALLALPDLDCDLVFLDVEMPEMTGLEFISAMNHAADVVIISAKIEYAIDAFDFNIADYITKPIDFKRFCKAVERVESIRSNIGSESNSKNLFIKVDSKYVKLDLNEIRYVEALSDYVSVHTDKGRFIILGTMNGMIAKLDQNKFIRIHRSYIANIDRIESIQEGSAMIEGKQLPVSRSSKDNLMKRIKLIN
jgi:DNA-binding LytR/AlgR family response regulator